MDYKKWTKSIYCPKIKYHQYLLKYQDWKSHFPNEKHCINLYWIITFMKNRLFEIPWEFSSGIRDALNLLDLLRSFALYDPFLFGIIQFKKGFANFKNIFLVLHFLSIVYDWPIYNLGTKGIYKKYPANYHRNISNYKITIKIFPITRLQ